MLLGFTIQLMYLMTCIHTYITLTVPKMSGRLREQMFVYVLLTVVTLHPQSELHMGEQWASIRSESVCFLPCRPGHMATSIRIMRVSKFPWI